MKPAGVNIPAAAEEILASRQDGSPEKEIKPHELHFTGREQQDRKDRRR